ncbi:unnamed protein product [Wuchereria bancrofti]|uniref:Uncharacterized protein n=1 Tax=Wuchereria bancrofti TaxID=6293 RepID=A0A3P7FBG3_WUCBA|nr:unnamed protein product [Wuchereria bancrofti]
MLNHTKTGVHYACSSNDLPVGLCQERKTKSNVTMNTCFRRNDNYCSYSKWLDDFMSFQKENDIANLSMHHSRNSALKRD